jgi:hypothetical protein
VLRVLLPELPDDPLVRVCTATEVVGLLAGLTPVPCGTLDVELPERTEALNVVLLATFGADEDETGLLVKFVSNDAILAGGIEDGGGNSGAPFAS